MNIRNVELSDLDLIIPLSCVVSRMHADAYPDIYKSISIDAANSILTPKLTDPTVIFRLAEVESNVLGYYFAEIRYVEESDLLMTYRFIYLAEIMVSPDSQGSGIGQALLADLKNMARVRKIDRIDLDVSGFNTTARNFFKRQGFGLLRERMSASSSE